MLELKNITKIYPAGGDNVHALKGISLKFRDSEFVSILGPSGCGKTTMLNILGGLDKYTEGDLVVNGVSTKEYKDRDWDAYRNHSVGFVFQTYNLIPHQSVLSNVELALTLSGVSKKERRRRAKEALTKVGLADQIKKKPAEMSGGQMQRVAIARAIVNNPDIILADEPTGALDTETSIQVMDILKEIAKDRLVVMVTHNPELAERYSTRIVRMLDGLITNDSNPVTEVEPMPEKTPEKTKKNLKKPSMSFATSFGLSLKNLFTKKGRTILTSFAGSIGIIGIALIYAVSNGATVFIDSVQEEALSSYPLTISAETVDISSLLETFTGKAKQISEHENDAVYQKVMLHEMINSFSTVGTQENDLKSFKSYVESELKNEESKLGKSVSGVSYTYNNNLMIYTKNIDGTILHSDTSVLTAELMKKYMGIDLTAMTSMGTNSSMSSFSTMMQESSKLWKELLSDPNGGLINPAVQKQYDIVYGTWPAAYDEVVLFVDKNNEIDDMTLYALGLTSQDEIEALMDASINKTEVDYEVKKWSFEEICSMDFRTILNSDCYTLDESTGLYTDMRESEAGLNYLYDNALTLHVVGIAKPSENSVTSDNQNFVGYTKDLSEYIINKTNESDAVNAQKNNSSTDIFTGLPFKGNGELSDDEKADEFKAYISTLDKAEKAVAFVKIMSIPPEEEVNQFVSANLSSLTREQMEQSISPELAAQTGMGEETISSYISSMSDEDLYSMFSQALSEQYRKQYAENVSSAMASSTQDELAMSLDASVASYDNALCASYYDSVLEFSDSTYEDNLYTLGSVDISSPATVNLYASTFEDKDLIKEAISDYNKDVGESKEIKYTDIAGILMSSVTVIIDAITYILIAFVAVSLVVSSIMIGVITLISVQERTKEIGILRAIGASKRNVSSMFNAETLIVGFASGLFGIIITLLLCIPINIILHAVTDIENLSASLPIPVAIILIIISMILTLIAGIIPSRSAAKKDPVVALRSE